VSATDTSADCDGFTLDVLARFGTSASVACADAGVAGGEGRPEIYVMNADGTNQTLLTRVLGTSAQAAQQRYGTIVEAS
jgi:hypothetical protein